MAGSPGPDDRRVVVAAAQRLIAERGLGALEPERLAAEAGVDAPTLRACFADRDALLVGVVEDLVAQRVGAVPPEQRSRSDAPPAEQLRAHLTLFPRQLREAPQTHMVFGELARHRTRDLRVAEVLDAADLWWHGELVDILDAGVAAGQLRPDLDSGVAAWAIMSLLMGLNLLGDLSRAHADLIVGQLEQWLLVDGPAAPV